MSFSVFRLVNPTFFLMRLSVASVVFVSEAYKVQDLGATRFLREIRSQPVRGEEDFLQNGAAARPCRAEKIRKYLCLRQRNPIRRRKAAQCGGYTGKGGYRKKKRRCMLHRLNKSILVYYFAVLKKYLYFCVARYFIAYEKILYMVTDY